MNEVCRLKHVARAVRERRGNRDLPLMSVTMGRGVVRRSELTDDLPRAEDLSNYRVCHSNDLVINRMSAYQGALGRARETGIVSPDYLVLRFRPEVDPRYAEYLFLSQFMVGEMTSLLRGVGSPGLGTVRTPRVNWSDLGQLSIQWPQLEDQQRISKFLNVSTAKIDSLIGKQEQLIEMLAERRQAVIDAQFTSSKESRLRRLRSLLSARPTYGVLVPVYVETTDSTPFVRVGDLVNLQDISPSVRISRAQSTEYSRTQISGGEVLLGVVGRMGQVAIAPERLAGANVARAVAVLRGADRTTSELLAIWLTSTMFLEQAGRLTSGDSVQPTLGMRDLSAVGIEWPTSSGSRARVLSELKSELAAIDSLTTKVERFIELSKERRAALITAAVTGKIDVRGLPG